MPTQILILVILWYLVGLIGYSEVNFSATFFVLRLALRSHFELRHIRLCITLFIMPKASITVNQDAHSNTELFQFGEGMIFDRPVA